VNIPEIFPKLKSLPPYVFSVVDSLKMEARRQGEDIIDLGMGNPDLKTPEPVIEKLIEVVKDPKTHRYSASRGIKRLREHIVAFYERRFGVSLNPDTQVCVTIGVKEGLSHLMLVVTSEDGCVFVPTPSYPIHAYSVIIAGGRLVRVPMLHEENFILDLDKALSKEKAAYKIVLLSFPHNPTTACQDAEFFKRIVELARDHRAWVVHDFAYADLCFDGYKAPSLLEVPGGRDVGLEFFSFSKSFSMAGWRLGFAVGNEVLIRALTRIKSYLDYGVFTPIQVAGIQALNLKSHHVQEIVATYRRRRDVLVDGLNRIGWLVKKPKATMFLWAKIPEPFDKLGSLRFAEFLVKEAKVAVSPGIGFDESGESYVRMALVENEHRIRQALRGIKRALVNPTMLEPTLRVS
jgi:alanine-synthesizing transaminase